MARRSLVGLDLAGLDHRRLRLALALFFLALAVPAAILIHQAYGQLKWESFHQVRILAEELSARIDGHIASMIAQEESRSFADYGFLVVAGDPAANYLQPSPLSAFPVASAVPGLMGYFQVDSEGVFSTPLAPEADALAASYGISASELAERRALQEQVRGVLSRNQLVQEREEGLQEPSPAVASPTETKQVQAPAPAQVEVRAQRRKDAEQVAGGRFFRERRQSAAKEKASGQAAFDRLEEVTLATAQDASAEQAGLVRVEDLGLDLRYQSLPADAGGAFGDGRRPSPLVERAERAVRKERSFLPEPEAPLAVSKREADAPSGAPVRLSIFESELDAFQLGLLDSGHFVLYRKVWRDGERSIQGALIEQGAFLRGTVEAAFRETALSRMSDLAAAYRGTVLAAFGARSGRGYLSSTAELSGDLLFRSRLSVPASDLELIFSIERLPAGPGARVIGWTAAALVLLLWGGFLALNRLGRKQIDLARQRQDFVSAVSHELKTPLTSIRMYAEMLREGWADEERRKTYYAFISEESERLTRLINNVLQLARLTRNELRIEPKPVIVGELMAGVRAKIATMTDCAGFALELDCGDCDQVSILVDEDSFIQILINLVDNAVKFARDARRKEVFVACRVPQAGEVQVSVRDFGAGVPRDQMKKIFKLFYRSGDELTRETVGTGIGLALVRELTRAMDGRVDLVDARPGAEFRLTFPAVSSAESTASC